MNLRGGIAFEVSHRFTRFWHPVTKHKKNPSSKVSIIAHVAIAAILQKSGHLNLHIPISYKLPPEKWMICFSVFACSAFFYGLSFPQAVSSLGNRSNSKSWNTSSWPSKNKLVESSQCSSACRKELLAPQFLGVKKSTASMSVRWLGGGVKSNWIICRRIRVKTKIIETATWTLVKHLSIISSVLDNTLIDM